jgi:glycosidase
VIIDGAFNHVGRKHWAFQDVLRNGRASKYADWFEITAWEPRVRWRGWDGQNGGLPVFKKNPKTGLAEGPRQHILAVTRRWLAPDGEASRGVDGFRLDVAPDVPHAFWIEWRRLVKSIKPEAYLTGEVWTGAHAWLEGDQFDAVMNYPFAAASKGFFVAQKKPMKPSAFADRLCELAGMYPFQAVLAGQNLFDSHDTDRFASMFVNPDLPYDGASHLHDDGTRYSREKPTPLHWQRLRQAVAFQMAFCGAPMVYYGSEVGMWSPDDPSNRQPMVWADLGQYDDPELKFDESLFRFYQRAIAVRRTLTPLRDGMVRMLAADDETGVIAFVRESDAGRVYVVLNRSGQERFVHLPLQAEDRGKCLVNWMDPSQTELLSTGDRPILRVRRQMTPWRSELRAAPYSTMILTAL